MPSSARLLHYGDLTAFHAVRTDLYQALFEFLRVPPHPVSLAALGRSLAGSAAQPLGPPALPELSSALSPAELAAAGAAWAALFAAGSASPLARCEDPGCRHRQEAFAALALERGDDRVGELRVLGMLAQRTMQALRAGSLPEASLLTGLQGRFLGAHAARCLGGLAKGLGAQGVGVYAGVAGALGWLLEEDLRLLGFDRA